MSFQQQQQAKPTTWQSQSKSSLKGSLILISLFCFLWSAQSTALHSSFLPQQMSGSLEAQYHEEALQRPPSMFFDEKNTGPGSNSALPIVPSVSVKLSMTRTLSSLGMEAYSVVLSQDGKIAFVTLAEIGDIKIVDVSNLNKITVIGLIRLPDPEYPFLLSMLALSPGGKTLFMSNMQYLHLIDVSNIHSPRVLGKLKDQNLTDYFQGHIYIKRYPFDYRISIAYTKDQKTLFIGGLGLQVVDISNKSQPVFIDSNTNQVNEKNLMRSEVRISPNGETLYLANGTLNIFNVSNPRKQKFLGSYSFPLFFISSVFPSKQDENTVYIAGYMRNNDGSYWANIKYKTYYEKINVRDPSNPTKVDSYDLNYKSSGAVYILGLSFNETIAYIFAFTSESASEFGVFNLQKNRFKMDRRSMRDCIFSLATFPTDETKIIIAQNLDTLEILEYYTNYPNNRIYSSANTSLASFPYDGPFKTLSMILSSDSKTLILRSKTSETSYQLKIFNVSDPSNPQLMSSFNSTFSSKIKFLEDSKSIVMVSETENIISFLNLSEDLKTLELTKSFSKKELGRLESFHFSSDGEMGYFICSHFGNPDVSEDAYVLRFVSFSDPSGFKILSETNFTSPSPHQSLLTKDNRYLFIIGSRILVYDVSNLQKPREISSTLIDFHDQKTYPTLAYLSPDEQSIFTQTYNGVKYTLRIYDIQNFSAIQLGSDMQLPMRFDVSQLERDFVFSPDYKLAYMGFEKGYIIVINMSNHTSPFVQGTFSVPGYDNIAIMKMSKDGKTIFYQSGQSLQISGLQPPYTLFIDTESIRLGEKYSKPTALLEFKKAEREYEIYNGEYKFLKASLFDVQINKNKLTPLDCQETPLPYWMNFDKNSQILTLEPKKQEHLGTYTLKTAFSMRFPRDGFKSIQLARNRSATEDDLLMMMISLGFIDQKLFLTPPLDDLHDFIVATPVSLPFQEEIYKTLKQYYFETFTSFDILPSLDVIVSNRVMVETLSENQIRVEITLTGGKFINKQYASIKPVITNLGSQIILEGPKKDINKALELLVINLESQTGQCEGTVTISDRLNPVFTESFTNASKLFKVNQSPKLEIPIQGQIDSYNVETGTYFTINFQNGTFVDPWNNDLSFELTNGDPGKSLPYWISFSNMSLRGTPPDEIAWRDLKFNLVVRNEFKNIKVPFTLNIKISPTFALKLLIRYSPYILSVVGLIVYANRIYNIVFKKRYRYPRDFYLKVGEEITNSIIPPMIFICKEKQESMIIMKRLKEGVIKELEIKSIKDVELAAYFVHSEGNRINKEKLNAKIEETLKNISEKIRQKLDSYFNGAEESKALINHLIFNQLTIWLLEKNQETKKFFDMMKGNWIDLVEWDHNGMCKIKESEFLESIARADLNDNYSLMTENGSVKEVINVELLKDAIESYALKKQSIDHHSTTAHIMIKFKMEKSWIKKFLKKDLEDVNFSDRGKMTYGIYFKVENDVLSFHGVPEKRFINKTVVIQITTKRHRILNEIWIHGGVSKDQERQSINFGANEEVARGKNYGVY